MLQLVVMLLGMVFIFRCDSNGNIEIHGDSFSNFYLNVLLRLLNFDIIVFCIAIFKFYNRSS